MREFNIEDILISLEIVKIDLFVDASYGNQRKIFRNLHRATRWLQFNDMTKLARLIIPYLHIRLLLTSHHHAKSLREVETCDLKVIILHRILHNLSRPFLKKHLLIPNLYVPLFANRGHKLILHIRLHIVYLILMVLVGVHLPFELHVFSVTKKWAFGGWDEEVRLKSLYCDDLLFIYADFDHFFYPAVC